MDTKVSSEFGGRKITISTGKYAKQASGSVLVSYDDTVVLVTVCVASTPKENLDFVPLTIEYAEKAYAAGKIPGGFFKREIGRPSDIATLYARIIDRPIRPLFPDGFSNETQVIATILSCDKDNEPVIAALIGASAALSISEVPFDGPIAGVRVMRVDGEFVCNPSQLAKENADLDLFVAVSKNGIVMVEGGGKEIAEKDMVDALLFAQEQCQPIIQIQEELKAKCGKDKLEIVPPEISSKVIELFDSEAPKAITKALAIKDKKERQNALTELKDELTEKVCANIEDESEKETLTNDSKTYFHKLHKKIARDITISEKKRIDGRAYNEVRQIWGEVGILPRTHGSAVFTRGETQALVTCTLGTADDEQIIDTMEHNRKENFLLHYNFPPFSVGEVRRLSSPGRREIGHGALAHRALGYMCPEDEDFEYTIRLVSEILESNGSSSMASVCGGTMALLDAGVPMKAPVAGIAMGLMQEGSNTAILSDILGDEDHLGDMDFKVCGTDKGITALQMDIKLPSLDRDLLSQALDQAKEGRLHILGKMKEVISEPREELSEYAPVITTVSVKPEKVKIVIGPSGKNIKHIISETGAKIEVDEFGKVNVISTDSEAAAKAIEMINELVAEPEVGVIYKGTVKRIVNFGAFVEIMPRVEGLLHISEIDHKRINNVEEILKEGDEVKVVLQSIERDGKLRLSRKALLPRTHHKKEK